MLIKNQRSQSGFAHPLLVIIFVMVIVVVGFAGHRVYEKAKSKSGGGQSTSKILASDASPMDKAIKAGKILSNNHCRGTGDATFTHLPMNADDFNILIPYGLTVGAHVTPIDHQYFQPTNFHSPRDTYPVYAMADAVITDIQPRTTPGHGTDYHIIFAHSCTFLYYYDLVTSLTGKVKDAYDKHQFNLPVKAGDQIGAIGGQTLDFATWNTQKPLSGFVDPANYDGEPWKIYTTDPTPYYTPELRKIVVDKNPRVAEPIAGKIDYDVDGKLIGNWFEKGSGGYGGVSQGHDPNYSKTHLSFAPDLYDPSYFRISIGSLYTQPHQNDMQHVTLENSPQPQDVSLATGLVKYDLIGWRYSKSDGSDWDQMTSAKDVKLKTQTSTVFGCAATQLTTARELKFEVFVGKRCSAVPVFDSDYKIYVR